MIGKPLPLWVSGYPMCERLLIDNVLLQALMHDKDFITLAQSLYCLTAWIINIKLLEVNRRLRWVKTQTSYKSMALTFVSQTTGGQWSVRSKYLYRTRNRQATHFASTK